MKGRESVGILTPYEAEHAIGGLEAMELKQVGSERWMKQHESLEKLNIQAHHNALSKHDEFVVESLVSLNKIPVVIHDLLVTEIWKEKLFPVLKDELSSMASVKAYVILFHEASLCNLLEIALFHENAISSADDSLYGLVEYCYRKISALNVKQMRGECDEKDTREAQSLSKQAEEIELACCSSALTILRFITEKFPILDVSVQSLLLDKLDVILALVPLIEATPFTRTNSRNQTEKYINKKWVVVPAEDQLVVTQTEGQVWLSLYNLIEEKTCRARYEYNTHRRETIMRLKPFFNQVLIDQLPVLKTLQRSVEELAIMNPSTPSTSSLCFIEPLGGVRDVLYNSETKWDELAKDVKKTVFADDPSARKRDLELLAKTYNLDNFDDVLEDPKCGRPGCGSVASQRCSRCKNEWYCSRECQLQTWKAHKPLCELLSR